MLPIILDPKRTIVGLHGAGEALARRKHHLSEAGIVPIDIALDTPLSGLDILYVAGADESACEALAARAHAAGVLINVEDKPALCDFHVPAAVRRGDLLLTVSSAGRSPGLVSTIREWLGRQFGDDWRERLDIASRQRETWRAKGLALSDISARTRALVEGWLP